MNHQCKGHFSCSCGNPLWKSLLPKDFNFPLAQSTEDVDIKSKDIVFQAKNGGTIQTLQGGEDTRVDVIAIRDGKILFAGNNEDFEKQRDILKLNIEDEKFTPIEGTKTLLPGFIEPHVHIIPSATINTGTDLSPFVGQDLRVNLKNGEYNQTWVIDTLREAVDAMQDLSVPVYDNDGYKGVPDLGSEKTQRWVLGRNVDPSQLTGDNKEFNATVLDGANNIAGTLSVRPIMVFNSSLHLAYINTYVIEQINKYNDQNKPEPGKPESEYINPGNDGILQEMAEILPVLEFLAYWFGMPNKKEVEDQVTDVFNTASARGVTYMLDAGLDDVQLNLLKKKSKNGVLPVRIGGAYVAESLEQLNTEVIGCFRECCWSLNYTKR